MRSYLKIIIVFALAYSLAHTIRVDAISTSSAPLGKPAPSTGMIQFKKAIGAAKVRLGKLKTAVNPTPAISHTLKKGSSGNDVRLLQEFLKLYGTFTSTTTTDYFGTQTARAVKEFQKKEAIEPLGIVGPKTRERILALSRREVVEQKMKLASSTSVHSPTLVDVIFSTDVGEDGSGVGSSTTFTNTTKNIYAILTVANSDQDTALGVVRYYNGAYVDSAVTHPSRSGLRYSHFQWSLKDGMTRTPGTYTYVFYVDGKRAKTITLTIN